jgi:hypothetical protein
VFRSFSRLLNHGQEFRCPHRASLPLITNLYKIGCIRHKIRRILRPINIAIMPYFRALTTPLLE